LCNHHTVHTAEKVVIEAESSTSAEEEVHESPSCKIPQVSQVSSQFPMISPGSPGFPRFPQDLLGSPGFPRIYRIPRIHWVSQDPPGSPGFLRKTIKYIVYY